MEQLRCGYVVKHSFVYAFEYSFEHVPEGEAKDKAALSPRALSDPGSLSRCSTDRLCGDADGSLGVGNRSPILPAFDGTQTTVMVRGIPDRYNRDMVLQALNKHGFKLYYDFVYLPMDFRRKKNLGYMFVNFTTHGNAKRFWDDVDGSRVRMFDSRNKCSLSWACPRQGKKEYVDHYRNNPVMHESVPEEYKPLIFKNGQRVDFPPPTKTIDAPEPVGRERTRGVKSLAAGRAVPARKRTGGL